MPSEKRSEKRPLWREDLREALSNSERLRMINLSPPDPLKAAVHPGPAVIEVENLSKSYGEFAAVRSLSFAVHPGEIVGLVGANGAGKTTTLRAITGILRPSSGTIRVGGHDLQQESL